MGFRPYNNDENSKVTYKKLKFSFEFVLTVLEMK